MKSAGLIIATILLTSSLLTGRELELLTQLPDQWKFFVDDDKRFARPDFDDSGREGGRVTG